MSFVLNVYKIRKSRKENRGQANYVKSCELHNLPCLFF